MVAAFCFGASVGLFTKYFFEIHQCVVFRVLQGAAIVFGCSWFAARIHRERSQIYIGFLMETCSLLRLWFDITQWMLKVYLTLFCAMSSAAFGTHLHLIWEAGGLFIVLCSEASLLWLYFTPPWRVRNRFLLLMVAAFCFGASVGPFTKYFLKMDQDVVIRVLAGAAMVFGCFWFGAWTNRKRSQVYISGLFITCTLTRLLFVSHPAHWMLKVYVMLAMFMGYLVLYSQEILYDARFGDIDFVNCTFTAFFHLPAILVHAARVLFLDEEIEQHRQN